MLRRLPKEVAVLVAALLFLLVSLAFMQNNASQSYVEYLPDSFGYLPVKDRRTEATEITNDERPSSSHATAGTDAKARTITHTSLLNASIETISSLDGNALIEKEDGGATSSIEGSDESVATEGTAHPKDYVATPPDSLPRDPKKPMNILLLYADDWRHDTLGAAGNPVVKTPVLDRLAKEGVRFTHNCVTTSICWSSRVTLYTGQYTARHNTTRPKYFFANWNETIYDLLMESGYHVGHVGKWGVNHEHKNKVHFEVEEDGWHIETRGGKMWHITEKNEADALRFLQTRPKDKPFFVNVAFFATHAVDGDKRQYLPQNRSLGMYLNDTIPDPVTNTLESYRRLPPFFGDRNEGRTRWRWRFETPDLQQSMMKNYYRMATEVDSACGLILKELEMQGELNNTLVIFTTDNGNFHAEHGLADKWYPHEESIRVPLIIKDPRMDPRKIGTLNDDFTLNIDLAPTILTAAGIEPLGGMMGRDMSVLYRTRPDLEVQHGSQSERMAKESLPWRTEFFYEHPQLFSDDFIPASEALVRKDYKYFYWPAFGWEQLFNLRDDPIEDSDLVDRNDTSNMTESDKTVLDEMRERFWELKRLIQMTNMPVTL